MRQQPRKVNGRLKNVCECSISMEKDQSVPIVPFDKPGADPDELEFEEDNEDWRPYLHSFTLLSRHVLDFCTEVVSMCVCV